MNLNRAIIVAALKRKGKKRKRFPKQVAPKSIEREYERRMIPYLTAFQHEIQIQIIHRLKGFASGAYEHRTERYDDAGDDIRQAFKNVPIELQEEFSEKDVRQLARVTGKSVSEWNAKILKNGFKKVLGIDLLMDEPYLENEMLMFEATNANLITRMSDEATNKIQAMVFDGFREGRLTSDIASDIEQYIDPDESPVRSRARLIARDQVNKLNGQLTNLRQTNLGIETYTWQTMLDERVRDEHAIQQDEVYSWDDPPAETGHPGDDIQCRCYAEPNLDDLLDDDDEGDESEDQDET